MKTLTNSDVDVLLGPKLCKSWCTNGKVDVTKFSDLFLNANFKPELALYAFLQRDQHWKELLKALETFDTGGNTCSKSYRSSISASNSQLAIGGVDRSDMESALKRLLALNLVTQGTFSFGR
jgi:hypothetical protein